MPTQEEVLNYVRATVAAFTGRDIDRVTDDLTLSKPPLRMDANDLSHFAVTLREYVKVHRRGDGTITVRDTKKDKQTVGALGKLVFERMKETD